ncbi:MAG: hypothetical protein J0M15_07145 [Deltaproteobacteria bacterium]|nr:hypothetical protein [Deltaproteobacteria bacterium]
MKLFILPFAMILSVSLISFASDNKSCSLVYRKTQSTSSSSQNDSFASRVFDSPSIGSTSKNKERPPIVENEFLKKAKDLGKIVTKKTIEVIEKIINFFKGKKKIKGIGLGGGGGGSTQTTDNENKDGNSSTRTTEIEGEGGTTKEAKASPLEKQAEENKDTKIDKSNAQPKPLPRLNEKRQEEFEVKNKDLNEAVKNKRDLYWYGTTARPSSKLLRTFSYEDLSDPLQQNPKARPLEQLPIQNFSPTKANEKYFIINYQKASELMIPTPYGFRPVLTEYRDYAVVSTIPGEYQVKSINEKPLPEKVTFWLEPGPKIIMSPEQIKENSKISGINPRSWPDHVMDGINSARAQGKGDPMLISKRLSEWFQTDGPYSYYNDSNVKSKKNFFADLFSKNDPKALTLAKGKTFNCDGAALIGAILLRDFFQIPTRVAGGRNIADSKEIAQEIYQLANADVPEHTWVEIFVNEEWVPFDFTPNKDKPGNDGNPVEKNIGNTSENEPPASEEKKLKENQNNESRPANNSEDHEVQTPKSQIPLDIYMPRTPVQINRLPKSFDSLLGTYPRQAILYALESSVHHTKIGELPLTLESLLLNFPEMQGYNLQVKSEANLIASHFYGKEDKTLVELVNEAKTQFFTNPTLSYRNLQNVKSIVESIAKYRDLSFEEKEFLNSLLEIKYQFDSYRHPSSPKQELVERIIRELPGNTIRKIVLDQYPEALKIGSMDQNSLYTALKNGSLSHLVRTSMVGRHFNFLLNTEKEFKVRKIKSMIRTVKRERDNEDIVLARPEDIAQFDRWNLDFQYHPDPVMMVLGNLLKDQQFMKGYKATYPATGSQNSIERKHTNIFFDVSGSMKGSPAIVQASAIAAIVDKAISERDPMGNPIHEVVLFPFGNSVYPGIHIKSAEEARSAILQFLNSPTDAKEDTNIQACFDKHFQMIYDNIDHKNRGNDLIHRLKLKKANMILLTDGGAAIDRPGTLKKIADLPPGVQTMFNLVAIGERNHQLEEIAQYTNTKNSQAMVTVLTREMMNEFINNTDQLQESPDAFVFDPSNQNLSGKLSQMISNIKVPLFSTDKPFESIRLANEELQNRSTNTPPKNSGLVRDLDLLLSSIRKSKAPSEVVIKTLADVLTNYSRWTGSRLDSLSQLEADLLLQLQQLAEKGTSP